MIFVACSGFPVPVSRYWGGFPAVEISDTELGLPGSGTVRRWLRESPKGYGFTIIAPKVIAESNFEESEEHSALLEGIGSLSAKIKSHAVVFVAPASFKSNKKNKATIKNFVKSISFDSIVLDLPSWKPEHVAAAANDDRVAVAFDPLKESAPPLGTLGYLRFPGPAGHRSRYDEASVAEVAKHCECYGDQVETLFCVFRNIDMHANGTSLQKLLKNR